MPVRSRPSQTGPDLDQGQLLEHLKTETYHLQSKLVFLPKNSFRSHLQIQSTYRAVVFKTNALQQT